MKSKPMMLAILVITTAGCGSKKSSDDAATTTTDSTQYTALKTIMAAKCSGSGCHSAGGTQTATWYSSEAAFKADLTSIQSQVASGTMPKSTSGFVLTTDEKAKFAADPK